MRLAARMAWLVLALTLAGCQSMPQSGPSGAAVKQNVPRYAIGNPQGSGYVLVDISKSASLSSILDGPSVTSGSSRSSDYTGSIQAAPASTLGVGDVVQVTLYEAESGGLFVASDAGGRTGNYLALPQQQVSANGTISIPYAGQVRAAGRSIQALQDDIRNRLEDRAIEPQAVVTLISAHSAQISVLGDVAQPAQLTIDPAGNRLLDVIARAGGIRNSGDDALVSVLRGGQTRTVKFSTLISNASQNSYVRPGDTIYVRAETRSYVVLGALNQNGTFAFDSERVSLAQAIGKAGGLSDVRADPGFVYLYREVDRATLAKLGINVTSFTSPRIPVVFHANLRDPAAMFGASQFQIHDHDVLYVSNAAGYDFGKFVNLVNTMASAASSGVYAVNGIGIGNN